jgi:hypothetical protein
MSAGTLTKITSPPTHPVLLQLVVSLNETEFKGREKVADQVIYRQRDKEPVIAEVLQPKGPREWMLLNSFSEMERFGVGQSWDGNVFLVQEDNTEFKDLVSVLSSSPFTQPVITPKVTSLLSLPAIRKGRATVCSCFMKKWVSITVRGDECKGGERTPQKVWSNSKWAAKGDIKEEYALAVADYVDVIAKQIFPADGSLVTGLLVVMGETGSGKSQIAYGLMHRYLQSRMNKERHPAKNLYHVVTLEDPIEKPLHDKRGLDEHLPHEHLSLANPLEFVDYTARHKVIDTDLKSGLADALRQKPAIVCVGEVREHEDWKEVIEFAGTGHFVVATAHAGALSESIEKLLKACDATTPAQRGSVARKILAMVQLSPVEINVSYKGKSAPDKAKVTMITIWQRDHSGADKLVSEGLSSIVPHHALSKGTIGAQAICEELITVSRLLKGGSGVEVANVAQFTTELTNESRKHDLKGI